MNTSNSFFLTVTSIYSSETDFSRNLIENWTLFIFMNSVSIFKLPHVYSYNYIHVLCSALGIVPVSTLSTRDYASRISLKTSIFHSGDINMFFAILSQDG